MKTAEENTTLPGNKELGTDGQIYFYNFNFLKPKQEMPL